ncbi:ABC transporter ATP-binding protein [Adlercreutzia sp. ZJ473]|uniref:ABC transporter ATP-binding protein n=1 Tax=Adlercreutzia sp. ZJ473 TaxID=2722822 RepID=UPI00155671FC
MLQVDHVTKRFGEVTVLEDVSLAFEPGVYGLLAPNGAGKTTLMKMLTTLMAPTEGRILWNGEDVLCLGEGYRACFGYLPQEFGFYPRYTPRRFLRYVATLQRMPRAQADAHIDRLLDAVGLWGVADRKMCEFSGGMLRRVGIVQALLCDPQLLVLDEPTAGLDPRERVRFRNLVRAVADDRIVIMSTHVVSDVEAIADEIILLKDGRVFACESPASVCARAAGRVFEMPLPAPLPSALRRVLGRASPAPLPSGWRVLSERQRGGHVVTRIACDEGGADAVCPPAGAVPVEPCLEDVFLYLYDDSSEKDFSFAWTG